MSFRLLLTEVLERIPGARAAVFVDAEGETVDLATRDLSVHDGKVAGAYGGIFLTAIEAITRKVDAGEVEEMTFVWRGATMFIAPIGAGYYLVLVLNRDAATSRARIETRRLRALLEKEVL